MSQLPKVDHKISYGYTIQYVSDVTETVEFYEKAFGFVKKFVTPENDYGELVSGETTLAFASLELGKSNIKNGFVASNIIDKPLGIEFVLVTNSVEEVIKSALQYGARLEEAAEKKSWGQIVAYIRDINGFLIEICTPITMDGNS